MKRLFFNLLTLLSTLLAAAVAGEWVRSQFRTDLVTLARNYTYQIRGAKAGVYMLRIGHYFTPALQPLDLAHPVLLGPRRFLPANERWSSSPRWSYHLIPKPTALPPQIAWWNRSVVRTQAYDQSANLQETESLGLKVPWWLLMLLSSVMPTWWLTNRLLRKRATQGFPLDPAPPTTEVSPVATEPAPAS
jgi:hypothetical protein